MLITDFGAHLRPTDPVYLMVRPDPPAARQLHRLGLHLCRKYGLAGQPLKEDRLHTTVLGPWPFGRLTSTALSAIDSVLTVITMPPFLYGLDLVANFGSEKNPAVVLRGEEGIPGLLTLQDELATAMRKIGLRGKRYDPHVTLQYGRGKIMEHRVEEIRWPVRTIDLVCSLYGRHRHVLLGHWPRTADRMVLVSPATKGGRGVRSPTPR